MTEYEEILLKRIVERIRELRDKAGVSQRLMYYDTNLNMGRIETGKHYINIITISRICDYFNITLSDFFNGISTK